MVTRIAILFALVVALLAVQVEGRAHAEPPRDNPPDQSRLGTDLRVLFEQEQAGAAPGFAIRQQGETPVSPSANSLLRITDDKILVDITATGDVDDLRHELEDLGMEDIATYGSLISGHLPISSIGSLDSLSGLGFARPSYFMTRAGLTTTGGDAAMNADDARSNFGVDGSGVNVGVISDSFDCASGSSAFNNILNGDLPSGINVLSDLSSSFCIDEGRAMMQIIHDVAPGADLSFHTAFGSGQAGMASAIQNLQVAGADVIVDDVIFLAEPMFQDGVIAQAIDDVAAAGISYFSSAGNDARRSYESAYSPGTSCSLSASITNNPNFVGRTPHDFGTGDCLQEITIPNNDSATIVFQWDSPYLLPSTGSPGSSNDLDIYIVNAAGTSIIASGTDNNLGADPVEFVFHFNSGSSGSTTFNILIGKRSGADPGLMKYIMFTGGATINEYDTASGTAFGHPNAAGAMAVGAAYYATPSTLEPFSSAGPVPILFDLAGNPIFETRLKPEIVGPDGGNTTFFGFLDPFPGGPYEADNFQNFFGTSAAAPHVAAVAALMLEANPSLTPAQIYSAIESTAIDMDDPATAGFDTGFDFGTGYGFLDANLAVQSVMPIVFSTDAQADLISSSTTIEIKLSEAPLGLSGIDLVISLGSSSPVAQITDWAYPSNMLGIDPTNLPDTEVRVIAVDAFKTINSSSTDILLATLTLSATAKGSTPINIALGPLGMQDESGSFTFPVQFQLGTFTVNNIVPSSLNLGSDDNINEGDALFRAGTFTDPDNSTWTDSTVDYGDGLGPQALPFSSTSTAFSLSHVYDDEGTFAVDVIIDDGDGGTVSGSFDVNVANVTPTFGLSATDTVDEDVLYSLADAFTDPGNDSWDATVDYDEGSGPELLTLGGKGFTLSHTYADPGTYDVVVRVDDNDGGVGTHTIALTVVDTFPTLPGFALASQDLNGDGLAEDTNGNGGKDFDDVVGLFQNMRSTEVLSSQEDFDFNLNGSLDFNDIVVLFVSL